MDMKITPTEIDKLTSSYQVTHNVSNYGAWSLIAIVSDTQPMANIQHLYPRIPPNIFHNIVTQANSLVSPPVCLPPSFVHELHRGNEKAN